jgi:hypothetical protein
MKIVPKAPSDIQIFAALKLNLNENYDASFVQLVSIFIEASKKYYIYISPEIGSLKKLKTNDACTNTESTGLILQAFKQIFIS